jgi:hypothetical protein
VETYEHHFYKKCLQERNGSTKCHPHFQSILWKINNIYRTRFWGTITQQVQQVQKIGKCITIYEIKKETMQHQTIKNLH